MPGLIGYYPNTGHAWMMLRARGVRVEARSFRRSTKTKAENVFSDSMLHPKKGEWWRTVVNQESPILVDFPKKTPKANPRWKTNWPLSMATTSRLPGGGVPAYLPPWFLRIKQTVRTMSVRSATAHMVPMNQPLVDMLLGWPAAPADKMTNNHFNSRQWMFAVKWKHRF